jgi:Tol biopolymer transport system component
MGIVYRARDEKLRREVAIKVLSAITVRDDEPRRRFLSEARALAQLNHPNILTVYDADYAGDVPFIATEWVAGKTLRDVIQHRTIPVDKALKYAIQIADAVTHAHARGMIHRDLKPANVMVTTSDSVKVLDFGLAKLIQPLQARESTAGDTTLATLLADQGKIVGTAAYMSPEQAQGDTVDARSDIFSFGSLLYEMVSGRKAFAGNSLGEIAASIVSAEPAPLGESVPAELRKVIERCMRKNPERRFQSMADVRVELEEIREESATGGDAASTRTKTEKRPPMRASRLLLLAGVIAAIAAALVLQVWLAPEQPVPRFASVLVNSAATWQGEPAFSPDGSRIAYCADVAGNLDIYVTDIDGTTQNRLTDDPADDTDPAWFPDGRAVAFTSKRGGKTAIWKTGALVGSGATQLLEGAMNPAPSPDGNRLAFAHIDATGYRIGVTALDSSGEPRMLAASFGETPDSPPPAPTWSPDGRKLCYVDRQELWIVEGSGGGTPQRITSDGNTKLEPAWSPDGNHIYFTCFSGGTQAIWRVHRDGGQLQRVTGGTERESHASFSGNGNRLVYAGDHTKRQIVLLERHSGTGTILPEGDCFMPSVSPDGSRIVYLSIRSGTDQDLWMQAIRDGKPDGAPTRLIDLEGIQSHPVFSPNGRWIACYRLLGNQREIWVIPLSGARPIRFTEAPPSSMHPAWSPDGNEIAFAEQHGTRYEIWAAPFKNGGRAGPARRISAGEFSARAPAWSPDGSSMAFIDWKNDEPTEAWVAPVDGSAPPRKITKGADAVRVRWDPSTGDLLVSGKWGQGRVSLRRISRKTLVSSDFEPEVTFGGVRSSGLFDISPDGRWLVFSREDFLSHIWLLNADERTF